MVEDMGYLLDDTGLPVNNGQVQRPGDWDGDFGLASPGGGASSALKAPQPPQSALLGPVERRPH